MRHKLSGSVASEMRYLTWPSTLMASPPGSSYPLSFCRIRSKARSASLVGRIVSHLIRARGVLVVVEVPGQQAGEVPLEYRRRCVRERLLAMNPNFSDE